MLPYIHVTNQSTALAIRQYGNPGVEEVLRWEGFVEKVGFEPGVKE